jgi:hypothetical protein
VDSAWNGAAVAIVGLLLGVLVLALRTLWLRARLTQREAHVFGAMLTAVVAARRPTPPTGVRTEQQPGGTQDVLVVAGLRRYHRAGCPAIEGRPVTSVALTALAPDLTACGLCIR